MVKNPPFKIFLSLLQVKCPTIKIQVSIKKKRKKEEREREREEKKEGEFPCTRAFTPTVSKRKQQSDGTALKLDFRSPRSIEFTQETVYAYGCPASIPKTLTIIQIVPINLLRPRAISPPDFRCKSALVCPHDDIYFRTIRPIKIIHHFQRAQMYEPSVYVFYI